jgi:hypothetical protein
MFTRRTVVAGGLLTIWWGATTCACAQTARPRHSFECMLDDDEAGPFLQTSTPVQLVGDRNEKKIVSSSGSRDFDYALAQTLSRLTDTFGVLPGFAFFDDFEHPNALATSVRHTGRADGTVLFGQRLLARSLSAPEHPDAAVAAICAHEFGHILQYKRNLRSVILAGQSTVKRLELHADFLAGYYAGTRKLEKPDFPAAVFATTQYSYGDNNTNSPKHHGRPDERAAAIVRGFEAANRERRPLSEAIQIGMNLVATR